MQRHRN